MATRERSSAGTGADPGGHRARGRNRAATVIGIVFALIGLIVAAGGAWLVALGGSWYYLIAGVGLLISGLLLAAHRIAGAWLYLAVFVGTLIWAMWEAGLSFWPQVPRLGGPIVLAIIVLLLLPSLLSPRAGRAARALSFGGAAALVLVLVAGGVAMFYPHGVVLAPAEARPDYAAGAGGAAAEPAADWQHYGRTPGGNRHVPFTEITPENVQELEVASTFRTGQPTEEGAEDQNTPLQIGDTLYICTPFNKVFALDAETGEERWSFDPEATSPVWQRCRGVSYFEPAAAGPAAGAPEPQPAPEAPPQQPAQQADQAAQQPAEQPTGQPGQAEVAEACSRRIVMTTIDARLIELDAETGTPCEGFGEGGTVDLTVGMGEILPGYYFQTSAPTVARGLVVVGGWVYDGRSVDEPSGAVRAFDATTGELVWAWDPGNPEITRLPPEGESYTRNTPNVWSTPSFDDELGLVYLPTGNATPDYWGAHRHPEGEKHAAAVVALEIETGRHVWTFQTVYHDLWDYDVPSQPLLYDIPDGSGGTVPALVQLTKRGQTFLLDRRTGEPLAEVEERPVPQGAMEGDWTSPTQPYSVGMPAIGAEPLSGARMWGTTLLDQLWCRIEFHKMDYRGEFTPPTIVKGLQYPGNYGGMNWGSGAIDQDRGILYVNDIRMPQWYRFLPREVADQPGSADIHVGLHPQHGTPYGVTKDNFFSPLGVPCHEPPYGTLSAIDLDERALVWQVPISTIEDTGPFGIQTGARIPIGMPTMGGPMSTDSGLVFFAGTQDYYLRAFDARTGEELWKGRLPVGAQATPMSYVSPESGRQFIVISAGGARQTPDRGDYVIAYALPAGR